MFAEFRFAARTLARWRGGFAVAVATLALGIGTATSLYSLVPAMLVQFPGIPATEQVARLYAASPVMAVERAPVALHEFDSELSTTASFAAAGAYAAVDATVGATPDALPVRAAYASPGFFTALAVPPTLGRTFTEADLQASQPVIVVSHAFWTRHFPTADLTTARVLVDGIDRTIVGVMPGTFAYPFVGIGADVWMPLGKASPTLPAIVAVFARLRTGATWSQAAAELDARARGRAPWTWRAIALDADARSRAVKAYAITLGPAILVLLIACVNVACMLLARGFARERELAVCRALGASRGRVLRLLMTEHLALALIAGAGGSGVATVILGAVARAFESVQPALAGQVPADLRVLPVALTISLAACLVFGLIPSLHLSGRDFLASLHGRTAMVRTAAGDYRARDLVVFGEVAAAVGLTVWAAMLLTLFGQLRSVHFSFDADRIVAMRVPGGTADVVSARVAAIPGVSRVAIASGMLGGGDRMRVQTPQGRTAILARVPVGAGFLETLGVPMIEGRSITQSDVETRAPAVVVSETAAAQLDPHGRVLGMRLRTNIPGAADAIVIGISRDAVDHGALSRSGIVPPEIYVTQAPGVPEAVILARVETGAHASVRAIGAAAGTKTGTRPARPVVLADEFRGRNQDGSAVVARLLAVFAGLTLLLAASGVFAVSGQSVTERKRELGIHLAIGAGRGQVLRMVVARELRLIVFAIAVGLTFSLGLTRALFAELTTISAMAPSASIGALILCASVAAMACVLATRQVMRLEPAAILTRRG